MSSSTQCLDCKHYTGLITCKAFPDKIPQEIINGTVDHTTEYPGDGGITFEALDDEVSPELIESVVTKLSERGSLEKGTRMEWRTVTRGGKTFKQRFKVGQKEPDEISEGGNVETAMTKENLESLTPLHEMGILGGINEKNTSVAKFKGGSNGIYKINSVFGAQGECNVQAIQSILGWNIAPETVKVDLGSGEGSCQKFISGDRDIDYGQDYGESEKVLMGEKHFDDLAKIFLMDIIVGNRDRHCLNVKVDDNDKVWAIDNDSWGELTRYTADVKRDQLECTMMRWMPDVDKKAFQEVVNKHSDTIRDHEIEIKEYFTDMEAAMGEQLDNAAETDFDTQFNRDVDTEDMTEEDIKVERSEYRHYDYTGPPSIESCVYNIIDYNLGKIFKVKDK